MLFDERLAYGARAVMMASTVVTGAIFLRMIAVKDKSLYLRTTDHGQGYISFQTKQDIASIKEIFTVAVEISTRLSFRDSSIIAGFTFC